MYSFLRIDFTWESEIQKLNYETNQYYENCTIAGIKLDSKGNTYVSLPRWKANVPATVAQVVTVNGTTKLSPYPSWAMNEIGNPNALQSVLGFEIDNQDRMWILDQGKVDNNPAIPGAIKLVVWDINSNSLVQQYTFSPQEADPQNSFLNDIVVDTSQQVAYITDSGVPLTGSGLSLKPALLVYDLKHNKTVRVLDSHFSTLAEDIWIEVDNEKCQRSAPMQTGSDGIALSCDFSILYYCPLTGRTLYAIETKHLMAALTTNSSSDVAIHVVTLGNKISASDGLAFSSANKLYLTAIENASIYQIDNDVLAPSGTLSSSNNTSQQQQLDLATRLDVLAHDATAMLWPDTIGFSEGYLYFVSNNLCHFIQGDMSFNSSTNGTNLAPNFRIWRVSVNPTERSYVHGCSVLSSKAEDFKWFFIGIATLAAFLTSLSMLFVCTIVVVKLKERHASTKLISFSDASIKAMMLTEEDDSYHHNNGTSYSSNNNNNNDDSDGGSGGASHGKTKPTKITGYSHMVEDEDDDNNNNTNSGSDSDAGAKAFTNYRRMDDE